MRTFNEETPWETARHDVRFTATTLEAVPAHDKQAKAARALLTSWKEAEMIREDAEDEEVASNALVALLNLLLDELVSKLAQKLRGEYGKDDAPEFRRYFPEAPSEVIRMGLETELARVKAFHQVAANFPPPPAVAAVLEEIKAIEARGTQAIERRKEAASGKARASLRIQTWKEEANAVRRSIANQLETYAIERKLPSDYADRFFPTTTRKKNDPKGPR